MTQEEAKKFGLQLLHGIMERNESYPVYANNVKQAIDALSEPSGSSEIPNDLEEAAQQYAEGPECTWVGTTALEDAFKAGANWRDTQIPKLPDNVGEAAEKYAYNNWEDNDYHTGASEGLPFDAIGHTEKCFKAGAEWMAKQLLKGSPLPEDTVLFRKGVEEGRRLERDDLALTWEDVKQIAMISVELSRKRFDDFYVHQTISDEEHFSEVLRRFNEQRKK